MLVTSEQPNFKLLKSAGLEEDLIKLFHSLLSKNKKERPSHDEILKHPKIAKRDTYNKKSKKATKKLLQKMTKRARMGKIQKKIRE